MDYTVEKEGGMGLIFLDLEIFHGTNRQAVSSLIPQLASVSLHPVPVNLMSADSLIKLLPEIRICERSCFSWRTTPPAQFLPIRDPFGNPLFQVLGIGIQVNLAGFFKRPHSHHGGGDFHPVVGRFSFCPGEFLFVFSELK